MLNSKLDFLILFVKTPLESCQFYQRLFGIKPIEESPTFVLFVLSNGVKLGLWSRYTAEPQVVTTGGGSEMLFSEEEVDQLYQKWTQLGIPMAQPPTDMDFGRTFVALDPDGHRIRVARFNEEV